ncbi:MAG: hypothetical protein ACFCU5_14090 [Pleurocapsa sp.]
MSIKAIALSGDGKILAGGSQDKTISLWDLTKGKLRLQIVIIICN